MCCLFCVQFDRFLNVDLELAQTLVYLQSTSTLCCSLEGICCLTLVFSKAAVEIAFRYERPLICSFPIYPSSLRGEHPLPHPLFVSSFSRGPSRFSVLKALTGKTRKTIKKKKIQYCQQHCGYHIYKIKNQIF